MKRLIAALLLLCMVLSGCSAGKTAETTQVTTEATTQATTQATEETTEATTEATEPPILYRNPLTGMPEDMPVTDRPYAVVINNIYDAQPLHGIGQADMLFEIVAEGGGSITRMLAVYTDISDVPKIGSVRSARTYLIDIARSFNAIFVHSGGSNYAYSELKSTGYDHLDGIYDGKAVCFYRDQERRNSGYALEHTLFTSGQRVMDYAQEKNLTTSYDAPVDLGLQFADDPTPTGEDASHIEIRFSGKAGKASIFDYDESLDMYYCTQKFYNKYEMDLKDANADANVTFRNVILLKAKTTTDGYRMFAELTGQGTGYYACGGKIVPITWSRASESDPFVYSLEDGTLITLGTGTTYVGILSTKSPITYE